jgi:hypothetical protein
MKVLNEISRGGFGRVERVKLGEATIAARKVFDPVPDILAGEHLTYAMSINTYRCQQLENLQLDHKEK